MFSRGDIFVTTLADKIARNFSKIKIKKASVKIPRLRAKKEKIMKPKKEATPISSIINILIKTAVEKAKREKKEKSKAEEDKSYTIIREDKQNIGRYGAVSKGYGIAPHTSYIDYGKLFGYLGKFRAQSPYESMGNHSERIGKSMDDSNKFFLIDKETMEAGVKYAKYFAPTNEINPSSLVPIAGMSSAEWEQFKLWMKLDPVMYRLKTSTS